MRNRSSKSQSLLIAVLMTFLYPTAAGAGDSAPEQKGAEVVSEKANASSKSSPAERAAVLYREGNALYDHEKFVEAEAKYQIAWDMQRSFDVAGNLGNVELLVDQ